MQKFKSKIKHTPGGCGRLGLSQRVLCVSQEASKRVWLKEEHLAIKRVAKSQCGTQKEIP